MIVQQTSCYRWKACAVSIAPLLPLPLLSLFFLFFAFFFLHTPPAPFQRQCERRVLKRPQSYSHAGGIKALNHTTITAATTKTHTKYCTHKQTNKKKKKNNKKINTKLK